MERKKRSTPYGINAVKAAVAAIPSSTKAPFFEDSCLQKKQGPIGPACYLTITFPAIPS